MNVSTPKMQGFDTVKLFCHFCNPHCIPKRKTPNSWR